MSVAKIGYDSKNNIGYPGRNDGWKVGVDGECRGNGLQHDVNEA